LGVTVYVSHGYRISWRKHSLVTCRVHIIVPGELLPVVSKTLGKSIPNYFPVKNTTWRGPTSSMYEQNYLIVFKIGKFKCSPSQLITYAPATTPDDVRAKIESLAKMIDQGEDEWAGRIVRSVLVDIAT